MLGAMVHLWIKGDSLHALADCNAHNVKVKSLTCLGTTSKAMCDDDFLSALAIWWSQRDSALLHFAPDMRRRP